MLVSVYITDLCVFTHHHRLAFFYNYAFNINWQEKEELVEENKRLSERLELLAEQNIALKSHIRVIRHNTVSFILQQMDTLHMQRDTEV